MNRTVLAACLLLAAPLVSADDNGWYGLSIATGISLFMNIDSATVNGVRKDTPAAQAGIVVGDVVTDIEGCAIPGCGAFKAKHLLEKPVGQSIRMKLKHADGTEYAVELVAVLKPADIASAPQPATKTP